MTRPHPISHEPPPADAPGWSGPLPGIRPVVARLVWSDDSTSTHHTWAYQWTRTLVLVGVETEHALPRRSHQLWLPADQVTADDRPPMVGEYEAAPDVGPTTVRLVAPSTCQNGHVLREVGASVSYQNCQCPLLDRPHRSGGLHSWGCFACSAVIYGPPPHENGNGALVAKPW